MIYYQLFTLFVLFANFAFPVTLRFALMSRKTTELYVSVPESRLNQLVPQFAPTCGLWGGVSGPVAGFQHVYTPTLATAEPLVIY